MKKTVAFILVISMIIVCFAGIGSASELDLNSISAEDLNENYGLHISNSEKGLFDNYGIETSDKITEEDGVLTIETDYGLVFTYTEIEDVSYLTQDINYDLITYFMYFSDPVETVKGYIEDDIHLNIFSTTDQCLDIFFYAYEEGDTLSNIIVDANDLTDEDAAIIGTLLEGIYGIGFEYGMIGDQLWFLGNLLEEYNVIVGITYMGGHRIEAYMYNIASDADIDAALSMVASVKLSMSK